MKINSLLFFIIISFFAVNISAQKTWEKPFKKWSQSDVVNVLTNSPWVKQYQSAESTAEMDKEAMKKETNEMRATIASGANSGSDAKSNARSVAAPVITVRLHSSLPVREAFVRLQEIGAGYDKMDDKSKTEFDEKTKNTLDCPFCQKFYIVTMNKSINSSGQDVEDGLFQIMNFEQLKGNIWLVNEKGEKQELAQFIPPKGAKDLTFFFFPRKDSTGKEFISPESKSFKIAFNGAFLTTSNPYAKFLARSIEFKVSSLQLDGKVSF